MTSTPKGARWSLRTRWARSGRYRWMQWRLPLFFGVMLFVLLLGMWGFHHYSQLDNGRAGWWTSLDATFQLFTLNNAPQDPMPLALSIARFLAPITLAAGIVTGLAVVYRSLTQESRAHRRTGHLMIIGCGPTAAGIAVQAVADGTDCALIDLTAIESRADELRELGLPVLSMTTAAGERFAAGELEWRLKRARATKASDIVVATGSDPLNARVARVIELKSRSGANVGTARDWRGRPWPPETRSASALDRIYVETSTIALSRWLMDVLPRPGIDLIDWFNIADRGARELLDEMAEVTPSLLPDPTTDHDRPYIVVFGVTETAAALADQFCRSWACSTLAGVEAIPRIGFVHTSISAEDAGWAQLDRVLAEWDARSTVPEGSQCEWQVVRHVADLNWTDAPLVVVVAAEDDVLALGAVRAAQHEWQERPIWVCPEDVDALKSYLDAPRSPLVHVRSLASYALSLGRIRAGWAEDLARSMQAADFLDRHRDAAGLSVEDLAGRLWGALGEDEREKNRAAVEGWRVALDVLSYRIVRKHRFVQTETLDWIERDFVAEHLHEAWRTVMDERGLWGNKEAEARADHEADVAAAVAARRAWEAEGRPPGGEGAVLAAESLAVAADRRNDVAWQNLRTRDWNLKQAGLIESELSAYGYMLESSKERVELLDRLGEAYYDAYADRWEGPEHTPWSKLGEGGRRADLGSARAALVYLHRLGFERVTLSDGLVDSLIAAEEIEALARIEHERWVDSKEVDGWSLGPKNPEAKTHPDMVAWELLAEDARDKDRERIKLVPRMMAAAGWGLKPRAKGATGLGESSRTLAGLAEVVP